jgi:phage/plasmid primase-like uncharacterized protein
MSPDTVRQALSFIPANDRELWVRMGMAVKSELGEDGFDIWAEWSEQDESYNKRDARDVWKSISPNGRVTGATLIYGAQQRGFRVPEHERPSADEVAKRKEEARRRAAQEAERTKRKHERAAEAAREIWKTAKPCESHPYLERKGISVPELKVGRWPQSDWEDALLIPAYIVEGGKLRISSLQAISSGGEKGFLSGGQMSGAFSLVNSDAPNNMYVVGEGFATVVSAAQAGNYRGVVAFSAGQLDNAARVIRERFPEAKIVVLADMEPAGAGLKAAVKAAHAVGGLVAIPGDQKDFNDLHQKNGVKAVVEALERAEKPVNGTDRDEDTASDDRQQNSGEAGLGARLTSRGGAHSVTLTRGSEVEIKPIEWIWDGIDAPEKKQPFGQRSRQNLSALIFDRNVRADCGKRDRYGGEVCKVLDGSVDVGLEQIRAGYAWWYRAYAKEQTSEDRERYERAEQEARAM